MNWLLAEQARRNSAGQSRWAPYANHRREITARLLRAAPSPPGRLCVLGAGNANDLDLAVLSRAFREVHLVDIDGQALRRSASQQAGIVAAALHLHGDVDLTGCWSEFAGWARGEPPSDAAIARAIELAARGPELELDGPFELVASTCVISQLLESGVLALGDKHPRLLEWIVAARTAHLRLLNRLTAPGGRALLATDFVSSVTQAELTAAHEPDWPALLDQILPRGNFFHGLNPRVLRELFQGDPQLAASAKHAQLTGFWRWNQGSRVYAVCALEFSRA